MSLTDMIAETKRALSKGLGIVGSKLADYETGDARPGQRVLAAVADAAKKATEEFTRRRRLAEGKKAGEAAAEKACVTKAEPAIEKAAEPIACDKPDWKWMQYITGAQIEYGLDADFSESVKENVKESYDLSEIVKLMEPGKEYYARGRLCAEVNGKKYYSEWSSPITLKA